MTYTFMPDHRTEFEPSPRGLPTRYYLPKHDVRMDLLEQSDTVTRCPYKGDAQ